MSGVDRRPANGRSISEGLAKQSSVCWLTVGCVGPATNVKTPSRALGCFFVPFFALGLFFTVMVVHEAIASAATYARQIVPCQIVESEVRESSSPSPWFAYIRYTFSAGESLRSSRPFETYREALLFTRRWPVGSRAHPAGGVSPSGFLNRTSRRALPPRSKNLPWPTSRTKPID